MSAMGSLLLGCGSGSEESSDDVAWWVNKLKQKADINDIGFLCRACITTEED